VRVTKPLVVGTALEAREGGRRHSEGVEAERAGSHEGIANVRQLGVEDVAGAGLQVMRLPELRDATPRPALPGLAARFRHGSRIALEDSDLVTVARQQHPGGEPAHAGAEYRDPGHDGPPWSRWMPTADQLT
jgi:hypothetical protein